MNTLKITRRDYEKLYKKIQIKNEHGEIYYECQNYKKENASLKENINQLMYENETKEKIINNANSKIDSLEYRVNMLNKANEIPTSYY